MTIIRKRDFRTVRTRSWWRNKKGKTHEKVCHIETGPGKAKGDSDCLGNGDPSSTGCKKVLQAGMRAVVEPKENDLDLQNTLKKKEAGDVD